MATCIRKPFRSKSGLPRRERILRSILGRLVMTSNQTFPAYRLEYEDTSAGHARFKSNFAALVKRGIRFSWSRSELHGTARIFVPVSGKFGLRNITAETWFSAVTWNGKGSLTVRTTMRASEVDTTSPFVVTALDILTRFRSGEPVSFPEMCSTDVPLVVIEKKPSTPPQQSSRSIMPPGFVMPPQQLSPAHELARSFAP